MKESKITTIKLIPDEGKWLTQSTLEEKEVRVFSDSVFCPAGQEDKWIEVTNEYKEQWEQEHPEIIPEPEDTPVARGRHISVAD